jgi:hypothetical protein
MPSPQFSGVTLDTHVYTVFTNENIVLDRVNRIKAICNMQGYLSSSQSNLWTFVGGESCHTLSPRSEAHVACRMEHCAH